MVGEATEDVGEPADSLEPEAYEEEGDIDEDMGEAGDRGLVGRTVWLLICLVFLCLCGFVELPFVADVVVVAVALPTLELGDCGEFGPELVSAPDEVDTEVCVPLAVALTSSSSSGISLA